MAEEEALLSESVISENKPSHNWFFVAGKLLYVVLIITLSFAIFFPKSDGAIYAALGSLILIVPVNLLVLPLINLRKLSRNFSFDKLDYSLQIISLPILFFVIYIVSSLTQMEGNGSLNGNFPAWTFIPVILLVIFPIINIVFYYLHKRNEVYRRIFRWLLYFELFLLIFVIVAVISIL